VCLRTHAGGGGKEQTSEGGKPVKLTHCDHFSPPGAQRK
jgi:hypothetical protein